MFGVVGDVDDVCVVVVVGYVVVITVVAVGVVGVVVVADVGGDVVGVGAAGAFDVVHAIDGYGDVDVDDVV